jgi:hypothetical protein
MLTLRFQKNMEDPANDFIIFKQGREQRKNYTKNVEGMWHFNQNYHNNASYAPISPPPQKFMA